MQLFDQEKKSYIGIRPMIETYSKGDGGLPH